MNATDFLDLAREWLDVAGDDLAFAELGLLNGPFMQTCFQCQQVSEKALKAYLFAQHQPLIRTHELPRLRVVCEGFDQDFEVLEEACDILNVYYIDTRYPEVLRSHERYTAEVAQEAYGLATDVLSFVRERTAILLSTEAPDEPRDEAAGGTDEE
ncbi:MAG: HEPN domain-containing protein [Anaerolineae bacterium]